MMRQRLFKNVNRVRVYRSELFCLLKLPLLAVATAIAIGIVIAIDAKRVSNDPEKWEIFTHGGRTETGIDAIEFAKKMEGNGAGELLVTSMDRDGTQKGYDIELIAKIESSENPASRISLIT